MQSVDINEQKSEIERRLKAVKTFYDVSKSEKDALRNTQNSFQKSVSDTATQLNKIAEQQKRYQRQVEDKMSEMTNFIKSIGSGTGQTETVKYLKKKVLETASKIEPQIQEIIQSSTLKALGCSEEQSYNAIDTEQLNIQLNTIGTIPTNLGIFIPVQSIDFLYNLKNEPNSLFGKFYYEKETPSGDVGYVPFGGFTKYPMNKTLNLLMDNPGVFFSQLIGKNYRGESLQPLFDIRYVTQNEFGVSGNFFEVVLLNRVDTNGNTYNTVGSFLSDYFKTITISSPAGITSTLVQILSGAVSMSQNAGLDDIANQTKFGLIIQRILGLCFDSRQEIDVSGVAKIAELDGVDDSFFELSEVDLRNIDVQISNIQNGVMEFVDCENVKLPVDFQNLSDQLIFFRDSEGSLSVGDVVGQMVQIIDSISQNPDWTSQIPSNFQAGPSIDQNVISKIPLAVAASILTPKTLLPVFILLAVTQNKASVTYNQAVTANNTLVDPVNNLSNQTTNLVSDGVDFIKKFKTYNIDVISKVNQIFLKTLFDILKRDILNLLKSVLSDINKTKITKRYESILRLLQIAFAVAQLIGDLTKCKSLLDNIQSILNLINGVPSLGGTPDALLLFAPLLPGTSPQRATINSIYLLQSLGFDTGPNTDGSPNLMLQFLSSVQKGYDKELSTNGKIEGFGISPPVAGGRVSLFLKNG
jgi:hypothetical protein